MITRDKRQLRTAFIATVGAVAMTFGAGCDNLGDSTSNPPYPQPDELCPQAQPDDGDACYNMGLSCDFGGSDIDCGGSSTECTSDGWVTYYSTCNPPPPECPVATPQVGSACQEEVGSWGGYPSWCSYDIETPCGAQPTIMSCVWPLDGGAPIWDFEPDQVPSCEMPPELCNSYGDEAQCGADVGCQWLVPGCGEEAETVIDAGCYPATDCSATGCGEWGSCVTGVHDPCFGSMCQACGAEISVCVADAPM